MKFTEDSSILYVGTTLILYSFNFDIQFKEI